MSSYALPISQQLTAGYQNRHIIITVDVIACALLVYDYLLTLQLEVDVVWSSRSASPAYHSSTLERVLEQYELPTRNSGLTNDTLGQPTIFTPPNPGPPRPPISWRRKRRRKPSGLVALSWRKCRRWWTWSRTLFLLSRYPVFLGCILEITFEVAFNPSFPTCQGLLGGICITRALGLIVAEGIFTLRTLAVYTNTRRMRILLLTFYVFFVVFIVLLFALFVGLLEDLPSLARLVLPSDYPGCVAVPFQPVNLVLASLTGVMVYEAVLAILMIHHAYRSYKEDHGSYPELLNLIYQDALLFYITLFLVSVVNVLTILVPSRMSYSLIHFQLVLHSILACRSMMHIRAEVITRNSIGPSHENNSLGYDSVLASGNPSSGRRTSTL